MFLTPHEGCCGDDSSDSKNAVHDRFYLSCRHSHFLHGTDVKNPPCECTLCRQVHIHFFELTLALEVLRFRAGVATGGDVCEEALRRFFGSNAAASDATPSGSSS